MKFKDQYTILTDAPLNGNHTLYADGRVYGRAYKAVSDSKPESQFFALQCPLFPFHWDAILKKKESIAHPNFVLPLDMDICQWPETPNSKLGYFRTFIFEIPRGERLLPFEGGGTITPWKDSQIISNLFKPIVDILLKLNAKGLSHRALRLNNIYIHPQGHIILGENVSSPPGFLQNTLLESPNQAQCIPYGRSGQTADDLYTLGILAIILNLGRNPWDQMGDDQMMNLKTHHGSYQGLLNHGDKKIVLPSHDQNFVEIIHRLLDDNDESRITLDEFNGWITTGNPPPVKTQNGDNHRIAVRPFHFTAEHPIYNLPTLLHNLRSDPLSTFQKLREPDLGDWVKNVLGSQDLGEKIQRLSTDFKNRSSAFDDEYLFRFVTMMDPMGPFIWDRHTFYFEGLGNYLLGNDVTNKKNLFLKSFFSSVTVMNYLRNLSHTHKEKENILNDFYYVQTAFEKNPDFGVERCIYFLNQSLHCLSPLFKNKFIFNHKSLFKEMRNALTNDPTIEIDEDPHIMAFLVERAMFKIPYEMTIGLSQKDPFSRNMMFLRLLQKAFEEEGDEKLAGKVLCDYFAKKAFLITATLHNARTKYDLDVKIKAAIPQGSFKTILQIVDQPSVFKKDNQDWLQARSTYYKLELEEKKIIQRMSTQKHLLNLKSRNIIVIAETLTALAITFFIFVHHGEFL
jgi:serine/threonine protein kinase